MGKIQQRDEKSYENSIFLRYYRKVVVGTLKMISMRVRAVLRRLRSSFIIPLLTTTRACRCLALLNNVTGRCDVTPLSW